MLTTVLSSFSWLINAASIELLVLGLIREDNYGFASERRRSRASGLMDRKGRKWVEIEYPLLINCSYIEIIQIHWRIVE